MVNCAVIGCGARSPRDDVRFFSIPSVIENQCEKTERLSRDRRRLWLSRINRADLTDKSVKVYTEVCSRHFLTGQPSPLFQEISPDWAPSQSLGYDERGCLNLASSSARFDRTLNRRQRSLNYKVNTVPDPRSKRRTMEEPVDTSGGTQEIVSPENCDGEENGRVCRSGGGTVTAEDVIEQGPLGGRTVEELDEDQLQYQQVVADNIALREEIVLLKKKIRGLRITEEELREDDMKVKFYTGLPTYCVLKKIHVLISKKMVKNSNFVLSQFDEFLVVMMRLRLNLLEQDLAYRFNVHQSTISRIIDRWLQTMSACLRSFIVWPDRETLRKTMPVCFKESFNDKIAVIIDCFEIFTERPSSLLPRAVTYSQYKHHNTCKFLIGITPQCTVSFISRAFGGRTSDKDITEQSGILDNLLPGDVVLADRGFNIAESVGFCSATLYMPAFTRGKPQLSYKDVEESRKMSNVRIHVERVIGHVRRKYRILGGTLPIECLTVRSGKSEAQIDEIVRVCCALTNFCKPILEVGEED